MHSNLPEDKASLSGGGGGGGGGHSLGNFVPPLGISALQN